MRQSNQRYERPGSDFDRVGYFSDAVLRLPSRCWRGHRLPPEGVRFGAIAQLIPVFVIVGSIPLALVSSTLTLLSWISIGPLEALWERFDPHPKRGKPETPTMPA